MENTLPFEYGFLYKPISGVNLSSEEVNKILNSVQIDSTTQSYYSGSGYGMNGYVSSQGIDHEKYFHPIGFIESQQFVIVEVMITEQEVTSGHLQMSGMNFQNTNLTKTYKRVSRAHIDVNIFIKYWEKVL